MVVALSAGGVRATPPRIPLGDEEAYAWDTLRPNAFRVAGFRMHDVRDLSITNSAISLDDSAWTSVTVTPNTDGSGWYRRWIEIPPKAGGKDTRGSRVRLALRLSALSRVFVNGGIVAQGEIDFAVLDHGDQQSFSSSLERASRDLQPLHDWMKQFTVLAVGNSHIDMA